MEEWFTAPACDGFVLAATICRAPMKMSCACWCRNCNGVACSRRTIDGTHVAGESRPADPPRRRLAHRA